MIDKTPGGAGGSGYYKTDGIQLAGPEGDGGAGEPMAFDPRPQFVNVADLIDPADPQGRSYRQVNATKTHAIPIGMLVELEGGERLRVVRHTRDCDQTPLYSLGLMDESEWSQHHGYAEENLKVVP